jgi:RNA polymerase sigma-70 factor (ECF subfamily)
MCAGTEAPVPAPVFHFEQVYASYHERIYQRIYALVGDQQQAEDLMQDTFVQVFKALPNFKPPMHLQAWLYRIATNVTYTALRRRRLIHWTTTENLPDELLSNMQDDPQTRYSGPGESVRQALSRMPAQYRQILLMSIWEGYSHQQLAEIQGLTTGSFKNLLVRARRNFRHHYRELEREVDHVSQLQRPSVFCLSHSNEEGA